MFTFVIASARRRRTPALSRPYGRRPYGRCATARGNLPRLLPRRHRDGGGGVRVPLASAPPAAARTWTPHGTPSPPAPVCCSSTPPHSREISAAALKRQKVTWPDEFTRTEFHARVDPLHAVARDLVPRIAKLQALRDALLHDISAKAGVLREPKQPEQPEQRNAGTSPLTAVPAPRRKGGLDETGWGPEARRRHE